jgi:hypothetical protein
MTATIIYAVYMSVTSIRVSTEMRDWVNTLAREEFGGASADEVLRALKAEHDNRTQEQVWDDLIVESVARNHELMERLRAAGD